MLFIVWWQVIRILRCDDILNQASRALFLHLVASLQEFEMSWRYHGQNWIRTRALLRLQKPRCWELHCSRLQTLFRVYALGIAKPKPKPKPRYHMIMTLASIFAADMFVHVRSQVFRSLRCEDIMNTTSTHAADICSSFGGKSSGCLDVTISWTKLQELYLTVSRIEDCGRNERVRTASGTTIATFFVT